MHEEVLERRAVADAVWDRSSESIEVQVDRGHRRHASKVAWNGATDAVAAKVNGPQSLGRNCGEVHGARDVIVRYRQGSESGRVEDTSKRSEAVVVTIERLEFRKPLERGRVRQRPRKLVGAQIDVCGIVEAREGKRKAGKLIAVHTERCNKD